MKQMWRVLDAYTLTPAGTERAVNHNNEWGGFSRRLNMPVFTGWHDFTTYNRDSKETKALVSDIEWTGRPVGLKNQERWLKFAEEQNNGVASFFVIHAVDEKADIRKVKYIDADKIFEGKVVREGGKVYVVGKPRPL
jgi:hypothetical protein